MGEVKNTFPVITQQTWWALRRRFLVTVPAAVTADYLNAVLNVSKGTAQKNIIPRLKRIGIIDQDGVPTERAKRWRDDAQYADVCKEIREEVYPRELLDALPDPRADEGAVVRWFLNVAGVGIGAAQQMAATYCLLSVADPRGGDEVKSRPSKNGKSSGKHTSKGNEGVVKVSKPSQPHSAYRDVVVNGNSTGQPSLPAPTHKVNSQPSLHIDVQIHIAADASAEQIDQIFASMAKHLYHHRNEI